ncbi:uncharacterized protein A4U43_C08F930 [Asparagus officinalis]|uniref:uncharacterized membrane protein At1g75140-like n=1 Tax=Asparagus officinalis TaxID=4686 RepID=UPI00098E218E|nr:uncharacterized membrane protein At1g75140-like [Asparagus officinalis]ONK58905.1 uncharacterized protein A4U43_C08F930 [Asparagus officinalis]
MAIATFLVLLLFSLPFASSIEQEQPQNQQQEQQIQQQDQVFSLLERHEAQLNRLETLIESLSKSVSVLESSLSSRSVPSIASPHSIASARLKPLFSEKFVFSAVARLESEPSCAATLPYADATGVSKYFAVGDPRGVTYVLSSVGEVVLEVPAVSDSPVTAILSYASASRKNESLLFTGHADGSIAAHKVSESNVGGLLRLVMVGSRPFVRGSRDLDSPPVVVLELHQIGRTRYIVVADGGGRIRVFTENAGTLYGTAITSSRPLAFMKQRLLFLTETGAGSLDLRSMVIKESECEGLNGSLAKGYVFDGSERAKAYGFTLEGDLIHVVLLGDTGNLKCRVRSIRKSEIDSGPVSIQAIRGYLLAVTQDKIYVYNVSSQYYGRVGAPRPLFLSTFQEIRSTFLNTDSITDGFSSPNPLIATDREKLVVLGLGGGYIGIYRSNFPVFKSESNAVFWTVPLLLFLLFLIGIWQFYVKKKDSLGWTPEEAFNPTTASSGSLLVPGPGERAFGDVSRGGDFRELRGSGLRGPSRTSRYAGGSSIPFRPSSSDAAFRGTADLKYRAQNLDTPPGFPARREPLFPNAQVVDEHVD